MKRVASAMENVNKSQATRQKSIMASPFVKWLIFYLFCVEGGEKPFLEDTWKWKMLIERSSCLAGRPDFSPLLLSLQEYVAYMVMT